MLSSTFSFTLSIFLPSLLLSSHMYTCNGMMQLDAHKWSFRSYFHFLFHSFDSVLSLLAFSLPPNDLLSVSSIFCLEGPAAWQQGNEGKWQSNCKHSYCHQSSWKYESLRRPDYFACLQPQILSRVQCSSSMPTE